MVKVFHSKATLNDHFNRTVIIRLGKNEQPKSKINPSIQKIQRNHDAHNPGNRLEPGTPKHARSREISKLPHQIENIPRRTVKIGKHARRRHSSGQDCGTSFAEGIAGKVT
jgi:hypothetical protein